MDKKHFNKAMETIVATIDKFRKAAEELPDFNRGRWDGGVGGWCEFFHEYAPTMYPDYDTRLGDKLKEEDDKINHRLDEIITFDILRYDPKEGTLLVEWEDWYKIYGVKPEALVEDIDLEHGTIKLKNVVIECAAEWRGGLDTKEKLRKVTNIEISWSPKWPTPEILD